MHREDRQTDIGRSHRKTGFDENAERVSARNVRAVKIILAGNPVPAADRADRAYGLRLCRIGLRESLFDGKTMIDDRPVYRIRLLCIVRVKGMCDIDGQKKASVDCTNPLLFAEPK